MRHAATARARLARLACVVSVVISLSVGCSGKTGGEHTSTIVRGSYGDPNPITACDAPGDASATDAAADGC